jgi:PAS domain S-box-containing protein
LPEVRMIKLTVVAPYEEFGELFRKTFAEHDEKIHRGNEQNAAYEIEVVVEYRHENIQKMALDCNVVIARGFSAHLLRNREVYVPVVEIPVTANDIIRCLLESKERFGERRVALMGTRNIVYPAERLFGMMGWDVETILMPSQLGMETEKAFERLKNRDCVVVGGKPICDYARAIGMDAIMIVSGREAMWQAITEAKRVAYISRLEEEKGQRFKTILDYTFEGILSLDRENRVTVINATCEKILGLAGSQAIGRKLEELLPGTPFAQMAGRDEEWLDEVISHNGILLAVNKTGIVLKARRVGSVITFQNVSRIQEVEGRIRTKTSERGLVARHRFEDIAGRCHRIVETIQVARKFSEVDSNALIVGKSGTGKEIFAQSIHNLSRRRKEPFVAINCAAIPENLLESELFGYVEGAFTGAVKKGKAGLIELAHRGTLFLDEIGELPLSLQGRLLRVLQEKELMRLGHDRIISVDVRIISATNRELFDLVEQGKFREDLYYRLDVLKIRLPTLAERREDIPLLAGKFLREYGGRSGGGKVQTLTEEAEALLMALPWGGNVRELKNACERLAVLCDAAVIGRADVERVLEDKVRAWRGGPASTGAGRTPPAQRGEAGPGRKGAMGSLPEVETLSGEPAVTPERIAELIRQGHPKARIAAMVGIDRTTLWRRMKRHRTG